MAQQVAPGPVHVYDPLGTDELRPNSGPTYRDKIIRKPSHLRETITFISDIISDFGWTLIKDSPSSADYQRIVIKLRFFSHIEPLPVAKLGGKHATIVVSV